MAEKSIIVAHAERGVIGHQGKMPWEGKLPADMKHFREKTLGKTLLMGRVTYESIGQPLPGRRNIVITRNTDFSNPKNLEVTHSLQEAYELAANDEIMIIGGETIYRASLHDVDHIFTTEIKEYFDGDRFFPEIPEDIFTVKAITHHLADERNKYDYDFIEYERT